MSHARRRERRRCLKVVVSVRDPGGAFQFHSGGSQDGRNHLCSAAWQSEATAHWGGTDSIVVVAWRSGIYRTPIWGIWGLFGGAAMTVTDSNGMNLDERERLTQRLQGSIGGELSADGREAMAERLRRASGGAWRPS